MLSLHLEEEKEVTKKKGMEECLSVGKSKEKSFKEAKTQRAESQSGYASRTSGKRGKSIEKKKG